MDEQTSVPSETPTVDSPVDQDLVPPPAPVRRIVIGGPAVPPPTPVVPIPVATGPIPLGPRDAAPRRRRAGRVVAFVTGGAMLVGAGGLAAVKMAGGGGGGGAGSPQDAVESLVRAVNDADLLGVLDALAPAERRVWGDPMLAVIDEARRLEVLAAGADPAAVSGVDVRLDVETGEADRVAEDLAIVPVTGTMSGTIDLTALPIGTILTDHGLDVGDTSDPVFDEPVDGRIATVERDGRWYVSIGYSLAESVRRSDPDLFWPAAEAGLEPIGAPSAEGAVLGLLDALEERSVSGFLSRLDPREAEVVQRVAPWFVASVQRRLDDAFAASGASLTLLDMGLRTVEQTSDRAVVDLGGVGFEIEVAGTRVRYRDGCTSTTPPRGQEVTQCFTDQLAPGATLREQLGAAGLGDLADAVATFANGLAAAVSEIDDRGLVVQVVDGEWFVSPVASASSLLLGVLGALDRIELDAITEDGQAVLAALDAVVRAGAADGDGTVEVPSDTDRPSTDDRPADRYYACQGLDVFREVLACVQDGLARGVFPRDVVEGIYLAPECGWVGTRWDPSLHTLPDADYVAHATLSAACFDQKIFMGVLAEHQRPFELYRVECLLGRNPANMTPDQSLAYSTCRRGG